MAAIAAAAAASQEELDGGWWSEHEGHDSGGSGADGADGGGCSSKESSLNEERPGEDQHEDAARKKKTRKAHDANKKEEAQGINQDGNEIGANENTQVGGQRKESVSPKHGNANKHSDAKRNDAQMTVHVEESSSRRIVQKETETDLRENAEVQVDSQQSPDSRISLSLTDGRNLWCFDVSKWLLAPNGEIVLDCKLPLGYQVGGPPQGSQSSLVSDAESKKSLVNESAVCMPLQMSSTSLPPVPQLVPMALVQQPTLQLTFMSSPYSMPTVEAPTEASTQKPLSAPSLSSFPKNSPPISPTISSTSTLMMPTLFMPSATLMTPSLTPMSSMMQFTPNIGQSAGTCGSPPSSPHGQSSPESIEEHIQKQWELPIYQHTFADQSDVQMCPILQYAQLPTQSENNQQQSTSGEKWIKEVIEQSIQQAANLLQQDVKLHARGKKRQRTDKIESQQNERTEAVEKQINEQPQILDSDEKLSLELISQVENIQMPVQQRSEGSDSSTVPDRLHYLEQYIQMLQPGISSQNLEDVCTILQQFVTKELNGAKSDGSPNSQQQQQQQQQQQVPNASNNNQQPARRFPGRYKRKEHTTRSQPRSTYSPNRRLEMLTEGVENPKETDAKDPAARGTPVHQTSIHRNSPSPLCNRRRTFSIPSKLPAIPESKLALARRARSVHQDSVKADDSETPAPDAPLQQQEITPDHQHRTRKLGRA